MKKLNKQNYERKTKPETWFEYFNAGYNAEKDKDFKKAENYYRNAIELNPTYFAIYNNLGNVLCEDKRHWKEAEQMYRKAIELNPNYPDAHYNLGNLLKK